MRYSKKLLLAVPCLTIGLGLLQSTSFSQEATRDPSVQQAFDDGTKLLAEEKYEEAIIKFGQATQFDDTFAEAYLGEGDALRALEDYGAALQAYTKARDRNQQLARVHFGLGVCHKELSQLDLAINDFSNAIDIDRRDPEILAEFGKLYLDVGNPSSALQSLESAVELDPNNAVAFRDLGWAHTQLGQTDDAIEQFEKSIELAPEDHETHFRLANLRLYLEEYPEAIDSLTKTIKYYEPEKSTDADDFVTGYILRADARLRLAGEEDTAPEKRDELYSQVIEDTQFILDEYSDNDGDVGNALFVQGTALRMLERFGEAIKALSEAIQLGQGGSDALLKRGICWLNQGEPDLARRDFEQAASINYEDPLPYLWIGLTHAYEEDYRKAIESYGEAIAKNPRQTSAFINRGLAYMQEQGYRKAVDNFNEAIRLEPNESEHFYKRGVAYMWLKEYEKAFSSFELAVLYNENNAKAFRAGSRALRELDRGSLADQYENRARDLGAQQGS